MDDPSDSAGQGYPFIINMIILSAGLNQFNLLESKQTRLLTLLRLDLF